MNIVKFAFVALVLSVVFIIGCKNDLVATVIVPDANHELYGNVVDEDGNPVKGLMYTTFSLFLTNGWW